MSFTRQQPKRALYFQLNFFLDLLCFQLTLLSRFRSYSLKEVPPPVLFPPPFRFSFLLQFFSLPILNCYRCNTTRNRRNWTLTNESWPLTGNDLKRCTTESSNAVWAGKGQELMQNSVPVRGGIWGGWQALRQAWRCFSNVISRHEQEQGYQNQMLFVGIRFLQIYTLNR